MMGKHCGGSQTEIIENFKISLLNMNDILNDLQVAINAIEEFYYAMPSVNVVDNKLHIDLVEQKHYERRFAAQLKSEYDQLIRYGVTGDYKEVRTDLEVIKRYIYSSNPDPSITASFEKLYRQDSNKAFDTITTIPDFFIHKQQDNFEEAFQKLIVEIKTAPNIEENEMFSDLFKLNVYVEKYNFQNGVFLITNNASERVKILAKKYLQQRLYLAPSKRERIFLFIKPSFESQIEIVKLTEL
ncbi:hypothetical protein Q4E40_12720 [Pontibacter sp. BT731]|uniref:hypothetical protein n=1 Tax=Pontibacter coccineus TaxID=3063328 RepID=UPI0026E2A819|nr:hypothetical protein [Pontibacter sp. BT731]MDO6390997.1 hypothetical protein [Pontibacter sp. BT731]